MRLDPDQIVYQPVFVGGSGTYEPFKKQGVDIYIDLSDHLLSSFEWRLFHGVGGSRFNAVDQLEGESEGTDLIPRHVYMGLDEENIVYSPVFVVYQAVLIRR